MKTSLTNRMRSRSAAAWLALMACLAMLAMPAGMLSAAAQDGGTPTVETPVVETPPGETTTGETPSNTWVPAVNLSNAGSSSSPVMITDAMGITHVIWYDQFAGNLYSESQDGGKTWSKPAPVRVPFERIRPKLLPGPDGMVYALWIDGNAQVRISRVQSSGFGASNAWSPARQLAQNVLAIDSIIDEKGILRLVYLTNADNLNQPAGVYYTESQAGGTGWSVPRPIFTSPYYRRLTQQTIPHVSLTVLPRADGRTVYLAWDEPSQQKILFSRSADGQTWEAPAVLDEIDQATGSSAPQAVDLTAWNNELMVVWKKGTAGGGCQLFFKTTVGQGGGWATPRPMFDDAPGCPTDSHFIGGRADLLIWQAEINNQVFLAAWNGEQWSLPQPEPGLSGVKDPVSARTLATGCRMLIYSPQQDRLEAVLCDTDGNQDIWYSSSMLGDATKWFPPPAAWQSPSTLVSNITTITGLNLVSGQNGSVYAMWTQAGPGDNTAGAAVSNPYASVMYAAWDGENWSEPTPVFRPRGGGARQLKVAINEDGELLAAYRGENPRQIFFTRANALQAFSVIEWSEAVNIPTPNAPCVSPTVLAGAGQEVFVAYAVPANEGRGIYINRSEDNGRTWTEPVQVFDAQAAGWEIVDRPTLAISNGGRLHVMWQKASLLLDSQSLGLGFASSDDRGATWSVNPTGPDARVRWAGLLAPQQAGLFRSWQQVENGLVSLAAQTSTDGGRSWQNPIAIATTGEFLGDPNMVLDSAGHIHLLQMTRDYNKQIVLSHWIWYNNSWSAGEVLTIGEDSGRYIGQISTSAYVENGRERLAMIYTADDPLTGGQALNVVFGMPGQALGEPVELSTGGSAPTLEATATVEPSPSATPEVSPTAILPTPTVTPDLSAAGALPPGGQDNSWTGLILGIVLAVVIVAAVFGYRVFYARRRRINHYNTP